MASCYGVIPARYASTRFPGKPLADLLGRPMFWHVYQRAMESGVFAAVTLATDDERIGLAATELGVPWVMTRSDHASGTDRVFEAASLWRLAPTDVVVNIQGDEPALDPKLLEELVLPFADPAVRVSTIAAAISADAAISPNQVKVVLDTSGDALYFSRSVIPCCRDPREAGSVSYLGHIGLYAFRMESLGAFVSLPPSRLEHIEKLEQLRCIENGIAIRVVVSHRHSQGVDTPEDLEAARALLARQPHGIDGRVS